MDCLQIWLLILSKFKQFHKLLSPLKSPENLRFSDSFRGNESYFAITVTIVPAKLLQFCIPEDKTHFTSDKKNNVKKPNLIFGIDLGYKCLNSKFKFRFKFLL